MRTTKVTQRPANYMKQQKPSLKGKAERNRKAASRNAAGTKTSETNFGNCVQLSFLRFFVRFLKKKKRGANKRKSAGGSHPGRVADMLSRRHLHCCRWCSFQIRAVPSRLPLTNLRATTHTITTGADIYSLTGADCTYATSHTFSCNLFYRNTFTVDFRKLIKTFDW